MTLLIGALTLGSILSLLAIGVFLSFRIFAIADMTVDGAMTLGAAVTGVLLTSWGLDPLLAILASFTAGLIAGSVTGLMQTTFRINPLLSGILMMTALYSVNLRIMGKSNVPLVGTATLVSQCRTAGQWLFARDTVTLWGWQIPTEDLSFMLAIWLIVAGVTLSLWAFLRTELGTAMRASGDNPRMIEALGAPIERYRVAGLALSNGIVALAGALWAQYQNFVDAQMGIGMIVWGLASLIIGEALLKAEGRMLMALIGAIIGSLFFRELVAIALTLGLNPNDLKLVTAVFVFFTLAVSARTRTS
jgi:putative ABC transport system permease protein